MPLHGQAGYVGSYACSSCHPAVFRHWGGTRHATAYETLAKAGRAFDPECVICHVVGLNYITGFQSKETSPNLEGVGCEACHGPGSLHTAHTHADRPEGLPLQEGYGKVTPEGCKVCHDREHDPLFHFETRWEGIRHPLETPVHPAG